jgi:MFS transporter, FSR family, fosmidomycin resistance protein
MHSSKKALLFLIAILWLGHFLVDMMIGIWSVHKTISGLNLAIAGLIGGVCAFAGEGMQVLFGSLCDKGYQKALIIGGAIATTASSWFVSTESYYILFLLYLLTCMGSGAFHPSAVSTMSDLGSRQGLLIGLFTTGGSLGMAFSQILYMRTHAWFEGQVQWLSLPVVLLVLAASLAPIKKRPANTAPPHHRGLKVFVRFFKQKEFLALYINQVCLASLYWGAMFLLPDILSTRGYSPSLSFGGGHMIYILSGALMMVPAGYLADRFSSRIVILCATLISLCFFYLFLFQPYLEEYTVYLLLFAIGSCLGIITPTGVALGTRSAPNQKGAVGAFCMGLVWCVSEGIGLGLGGFLATCFEEDAPAKALSILGSLFIVALGAAYALPQKEEALPAMEYLAE